MQQRKRQRSAPRDPALEALHAEAIRIVSELRGRQVFPEGHKLYPFNFPIPLNTEAAKNRLCEAALAALLGAGRRSKKR
jgi:hypothetical protein